MRRDSRSPWRKKRWAIPGMLIAVLFVGLAVAWLSRERIADNIIADQLEAYDLPASYKIDSIAGRRQVLSNLVIGDPAAPDFTAKRVVVTLKYGMGLPTVGSVTLAEPRIYGSFRDGRLTFGTLDRVIFAESDQPPTLPDFSLAIRDGRGLIETDWGPIGFKSEGQGTLRSGFAGIFAATAPRLALPGCTGRNATVFGKVTTSAGAPSFSGPLRLSSLDCVESGLTIANYAAALEVSLDKELANPTLDARLDGGETRHADYVISGLTGSIHAQLREGAASGRFSLAGRGASSPQVAAAVLTAEGQARGSADLRKLEIDSQVEGNGLRLGPKLIGVINDMVASGEGTLLAPLASQIGRALQAETRGSALAADIRVRKGVERLAVLIPSAELRGGSGGRIVSLSRVEIASDGKSPPRIAGNIAMGGANLPRIAGRMERAPGGAVEFSLAMERYAAGEASLAVPRMVMRQSAAGALRFAGQVVASGPLPGGAASNLRIPVDGSWSPGGTLALWSACTDVDFDRLEMANLRFERRSLQLCPPRGKPILSSGAGGLRIAAGLPSIDLEGFLGETPIRLASGPIGFAYPGAMTARAIDVTLGPIDTASRFRISNIDAFLDKGIAGTFSEAEVKLAAVPLDISDGAGTWDYADGQLSIFDASFRLTDRQRSARFEALVARGATLALRDNVIDANAEMRHPASDRLVGVADIRHNLASAAGHADLLVPNLKFDEGLQPDELSHLALGVIANADGIVSGKGRIDWDAEGGITSSGTFGSEGLDFAAAFGPVNGASGQIEFTDLLSLTTKPGQKLYVASINPGVEVLDGEVDFELRDGKVLTVAGGSWPFMGGRLILRSVDFNFGVSEERRYIFEIVGLEAAQFVQQMELENISATGVFDGTVPIVFDANGNGQIETGVLISRPPGGNLSYVGELTYEDLSPIANFAFDALRSLDYRQMRVIMEGPLIGEIVTRVRFDGVNQGEGAKSNFVTRRLAGLPLQFRVNIKAQFYQLLTSLKSLYDPAAVRDPRELGLLSDDGKRFIRREVSGEDATPKIEPEDLIPDESPIQPQESE
ncbi:YdbH domain-containing protein [Erythrobacter mangrovi]|uniref:YdbH domain-containing protein n=2 Tax=Erythrobacter mangrovi TaxID=2739433 RepID=A0A7D3XT49_9SPHN|nr:YdbH domain-containing protein [Erythrobacter mangrovi]